MEAVVEEGSMQQIRVAEVYVKYKEKPRNWETDVYWFWGPPGSGKSKAAFEQAEKMEGRKWVAGKNSKWWEGYDGHETVIIDDYRKGWCSFAELLRITDRYEYRVEVKGGSRQLRAKNIFITCPHPPTKVFEELDEDLTQITRRIKLLVEIKKIS